MDLRGVIFDLDGVLCHTDRYHYLAWKGLADRLGIPFDERANNALRGVSRMESLSIVLSLGNRQYADEEKAAMADEKNEAYRAYLMNMGPEDLARDAAQMLGALRAQGLSLAVGSSSKNTPLILTRTGIGRWFDAVADGNHISRSKPDPEVFLLAARRLGLTPEQCIVVEDACAGIEAAKAGGFVAVGIGEAAADPRADHAIDSLGELAPLCTRLKKGDYP